MSVVLAGLRGSFDDESGDIGGLVELVQRPTWIAQARCKCYDLPWLFERKPCEAILAEMAAVARCAESKTNVAGWPARRRTSGSGPASGTSRGSPAR